MGRLAREERQLREAVKRSAIATATREAELRRREAQELSMVTALSQVPSLEERALNQAIQLSRDTALEDEIRREARLLARWELDDRLAIETSKMDEFWRTLPSQLLWLKQPSALKVLLQRPTWLRA